MTIERVVMFAIVSSSMTCCHAASLKAAWGRAADAAAALRLPAAVRSCAASASMNGVAGPSASMSPLAASAVTLDEYGLYHDDRALVVDTHRTLYDAIVARDPARIRAASDQHWETSGGSFAELADLDALLPPSES